MGDINRKMQIAVYKADLINKLGEIHVSYLYPYNEEICELAFKPKQERDKRADEIIAEIKRIISVEEV